MATRQDNVSVFLSINDTTAGRYSSDAMLHERVK